MSGHPSWTSAEIGPFHNFSAFFALFRRKSRKRRKKAFFLRYPQICLNPHLSNPPFVALETMQVFYRGGTNCVFGKPWFRPLPKGGRFDENGENDEFAFYPLKTRASLIRPPKTTKMTKMAVVTQAKAWFRKSRVCSSLILLTT